MQQDADNIMLFHCSRDSQFVIVNAICEGYEADYNVI
jgi:hypothetical protein